MVSIVGLGSPHHGTGCVPGACGAQWTLSIPRIESFARIPACHSLCLPVWSRLGSVYTRQQGVKHITSHRGVSLQLCSPRIHFDRHVSSSHPRWNGLGRRFLWFLLAWCLLHPPHTRSLFGPSHPHTPSLTLPSSHSEFVGLKRTAELSLLSCLVALCAGINRHHNKSPLVLVLSILSHDLRGKVAVFSLPRRGRISAYQWPRWKRPLSFGGSS